MSYPVFRLPCDNVQHTFDFGGYFGVYFAWRRLQGISSVAPLSITFTLYIPPEQFCEFLPGSNLDCGCRPQCLHRILSTSKIRGDFGLVFSDDTSNMPSSPRRDPQHGASGIFGQRGRRIFGEQVFLGWPAYADAKHSVLETKLSWIFSFLPRLV